MRATPAVLAKFEDNARECEYCHIRTLRPMASGHMKARRGAGVVANQHYDNLCSWCRDSSAFAVCDCQRKMDVLNRVRAAVSTVRGQQLRDQMTANVRTLFNFDADDATYNQAALDYEKEMEVSECADAAIVLHSAIPPSFPQWCMGWPARSADTPEPTIWTRAV